MKKILLNDEDINEDVNNKRIEELKNEVEV